MPLTAYVTRHVKRKTKAYVKSKLKPTRLSSKRANTQVLVNRAVSKVIGKISENKVQALNTQRYVNPVPINSDPTYTSPTYVQGYCVGQTPPSWTSGLHTGLPQYVSLGSFNFPPGTGAHQRIGDSMFAKSTSLTLNISKLNNDDEGRLDAPYKYRMIVFRPKQRVRTPGSPSDPTLDLFINSSGDNFGHGTSVGTEFMDIWQSILNRKDYVIIQDKKFMLSTPGNASRNVIGLPAWDVDMSGRHSKDINLKIPYSKKIKFDAATNLPEDLNMATGILIFGQASGNHKTNFELWHTSLQGVSSFLDG